MGRLQALPHGRSENGQARADQSDRRGRGDARRPAPRHSRSAARCRPTKRNAMRISTRRSSSCRRSRTTIGSAPSIATDRTSSTEALADVDKALELEPDHAATHRAAGLDPAGPRRNPTRRSRRSTRPASLRRRRCCRISIWAKSIGKQGDLKKAVEQLTKALELAPDDAATLLLRANVYYQLDDSEAALKDVDAAIKLQPQLLRRPSAAGGDSRRGRNASIEAIAQPGEAGAARTESNHAARTAGDVLSRRRPAAEKHRDVQQIIELEPENYRALRFRGDANLNIGNHAEAVADFDAALQLNDDGRRAAQQFRLGAGHFAGRQGPRRQAVDRTGHQGGRAFVLQRAAHFEHAGGGLRRVGRFRERQEWSQKAIDVSQRSWKRRRTRPIVRDWKKPTRHSRRNSTSTKKASRSARRQEQEDKTPARPRRRQISDVRRHSAPPMEARTKTTRAVRSRKSG